MKGSCEGPPDLPPSEGNSAPLREPAPLASLWWRWRERERWRPSFPPFLLLPQPQQPQQPQLSPQWAKWTKRTLVDKGGMKMGGMMMGGEGTRRQMTDVE